MQNFLANRSFVSYTIVSVGDSFPVCSHCSRKVYAFLQYSKITKASYLITGIRPRSPGRKPGILATRPNGKCFTVIYYNAKSSRNGKITTHSSHLVSLAFLSLYNQRIASACRYTMVTNWLRHLKQLCILLFHNIHVTLQCITVWHSIKLIKSEHLC